tara:strand:+ start:632 stop:1501 length:870 start_codon:yes stop_codon:yes gene_type:complete
MNYSTLGIAPIILALSLGNAYAEDYATAHTFAAGDVISADMMNELFDRIEFSNSTINSDTILGTWVCTATQKYGANHLSTLPAGLTSDIDNLYQYRSDDVTFINDGDGTYSLSTATKDVIYLDDRAFFEGRVFAKYSIQNNILFLKVTSPSLMAVVRNKIKSISNTRFQIERAETLGESSAQTLILCDKKLLPPTNPTAFAVATTNLSNVLTWTDNSSDESGFKVYKKTTVAGAWTLIDAGAGLTVSTNIVTYTDTVSAAGDNWYRVKASHVTNGDSIGSKVIKVTNSN